MKSRVSKVKAANPKQKEGSTMKRMMTLIAVVGLVLALAPAAQAGTIPSGDPLIPAGLEAGDTFHLAFVTSTTRDATSTDIADYNSFVTTVANGAESVVKDRGWTWNAMVSTPTMNARDNMSVSGGGGFATYRLDSVLLADDYTQLIDGGRPFNSGVYLTVDETGTIQGEQRVWGGTGNDLAATVNREMGQPYDLYNTAVSAGKLTAENGIWGQDWFNLTDTKAMYAFSEPLTIQPPPPAGTMIMIK